LPTVIQSVPKNTKIVLTFEKHAVVMRNGEKSQHILWV